MPNIEIKQISLDLKLGALSITHPDDSTTVVKASVHIPFIDGTVGVSGTFVNHSAPPPPPQRLGPSQGMFFTAPADAIRTMVPEADPEIARYYREHGR